MIHETLTNSIKQNTQQKKGKKKEQTQRTQVLARRAKRKGGSLRASPLVLSMWLQTVQFIVKKSKCTGLDEEIGFSAPNSCSLPWLVKGATQSCTSKKECNKLDLTAAEYFWLIDHNYWSKWFAISSSHVRAVLVKVLLLGLPKKNQLNKLRHLILLSRVTYWAPVEML